MSKVVIAVVLIVVGVIVAVGLGVGIAFLATRSGKKPKGKDGGSPDLVAPDEQRAQDKNNKPKKIKYGFFERLYDRFTLSRGEIGEKEVSYILHSVAQAYGGIVWDNYYFQGSRRSVQIDHIFINPNGVFVIETKNYAGYIYGTEKQREWTQVLANGKVKNKLYNPVMQNAGHIYELRRILGRHVPIMGVVVFVKANIENVQAGGIITPEYLPNCLLCFNQGFAITQEQIQSIYVKLQKSYIQDENISAKHIQEVQEMLIGVESNLVCPRCGGRLVLRRSAYGEFYGCSNYPKCTFKKDKKAS